MTTTADPVGPGIAFIASHESPLEIGDYRLTMTQTASVQGVPHVYSTERRFLVRGPRVLQPADFTGAFPPENGLGEYSNTLPHVILSRSTLPWERTPLAGEPVAGQSPLMPWLAVLLFAEDGPPATVVTLAELQGAVSGSPRWPGLALDGSDDPTAKVTVVDVEQELLRAIMPTGPELAALAHVRSTSGNGSDGSPESDTAVLVGNRLPVPGGRNTAHLVAVEGRYRPGPDGTPIFDSGPDGDLVRLISVKSWSFSCVEPTQTFGHLVRGLDPYGQPLPDGTHGSATLRLPPVPNPDAEKRLAAGNAPTLHTLRDGERTVSWYRGPLVPGQVDPADPSVSVATLRLPVRAADALCRYEPATGLLDVSYATAWQLGRMLTLSSRQVSTSLFLYKRQLIQQAKAAGQADMSHLPLTRAVAAEGPDATDPAVTVRDWFDALRTLTGVPFRFLVPDEHMLPPESIRFFAVDPGWVRCCLDGAYSIGRVTAGDVGHDSTLTANPLEDPGPASTGVLIRSAVVSGWPDLRLEARAADGTVLPELRRTAVSPNVLLVLYPAPITSLAISERPEDLHFGFDRTDDGTGLVKQLRDPTNGHEKPDGLRIDAVPWRDADLRVVDVAELLAEVDGLVGSGVGGPATTSAQLALQMVEGVEQVVFHR